ncbi:MAG: FKBP-type peptidyl-prolyl cis-trans isomerase [Bacteroidetes bacterium]|nr:FKBP-type peptidyl-prolyl cis-trans isomerase [Bacteroidota bacterium]
MKKIFSTLFVATLVATAADAQTKTTKDGYAYTPNGLEYKVIKDAPGGRKPVPGDFIEVHLTCKVDDSLLFATRPFNNNQPIEYQVPQPAKGDIAEGFLYMTAGDSAIFRASIDSLWKLPNFNPQPWMKQGIGQKITYYVALVSVKTQEEKKAQMAAAAVKQKEIDEKLLQDYFTKNNIKPMKTASGLYYTIEKPGTGGKPSLGDTVSANYTGKLMDGTAFDSNVDPMFQHVQPFEFPVGMRRVIPGWDEGFMLLNKGAKGTLYIPSALAYGANSPDPKKIPANSCMIFTVELVDFKSAGAPAKKN